MAARTCYKGMEMEIADKQLLQKKNKTKHALVMPWPGLGHINPMMHLSRMLSSAGITVTFVNTLFNHRRLLRSMAQNSKTPQNSAQLHQDMVELDVISGAAPIRLIGISDGVRDPDYVVTDFQKICQGLIDMTDSLTELALSLRPPITSVIGDIFCICTPTVARRLQVPHVGFWTQSAASYAAHVLFIGNPAHFKELMKIEKDANPRPIACIPGCPPLNPKEVITFLQSCDTSEFFFKYLSQNFGEEMMKHTHVVMNSFEGLEPEAMKYVKGKREGVLEMGPMLPEEYMRGGKWENGRRVSISEEDEGCVGWLDKQPEGGVLFVAFGSLALLLAEQVAELAAGLENSGCRILIAVRRALVMGEDAVFPSSFAESDRIRIVEWAPQLAVLAHPSVGAFLTHAGWNSVVESISNGVPMLCWPFFADQMMNSRCIVDYWHIGLDFQPHEFTGLIPRDHIQAKVQRLMDPSLSYEMRIRARHLSLLAKELRSSSDSSQPGFQSLLSFLLK